MGKTTTHRNITAGFDNNIKTIGETEIRPIRVFIDAFKGQNNRKLISRIYSSLQLERGLSAVYIKIKSIWETEAKIQMTEN